MNNDTKNAKTFTFQELMNDPLTLLTNNLHADLQVSIELEFEDAVLRGNPWRPMPETLKPK